MAGGPPRERSAGASWFEVLDWWRVYVPLLAASLLSAVAAWVAPSFELAAVLAVIAVLGGLVVGSVWQGSRRP